MLKFAKAVVRDTLNRWPKKLCRDEFEQQQFLRFNARPIEFGFVFRKLGELYPRTILDVGTGPTALPQLMRYCGPLVTATDNVRDYWANGMVNRHYHVIDDDITATRLKGKYDLVTCVSVLEHIVKFDAAVNNMFSLLDPGGHLIITCPYNERNYVRNCYELPDSSYGQDVRYITQSYSRREVDRWLTENRATLVDQEFFQFWEGEHWTQGKQLIPPKRVSAADKHQHTNMLFRKL